MDNKFLLNCVGLALASCFFSQLVASASDAEFNAAVGLYLKNNFDEALPKFQAMEKSEPKNENIRYYEALCYQRIGEKGKAADEYSWILKNSKNAAFKEIIRERIKRVSPSFSEKGSEPAVAEKLSQGPVRKVIFFSTNWCSVCRAFDPTWVNTSQTFKGRIKFEHLNAEDPANKALVDRYRPKAYPTLVYLDAKDNVMENGASAPMGESFAKHLKDLGAEK